MSFEQHLAISTVVDLSSSDKVEALKELAGVFCKALDLKKPKTLAEEILKREEAASVQAAARPGGPALNERDRKRKEAEQRQLRYEKTRPLQQAIERLERDIERSEQRKAALEAVMADPAFYRDGERVKEVTAEYRSLQAELNDQYHRWNDLDKELQRVLEEFQMSPRP